MSFLRAVPALILATLVAGCAAVPPQPGPLGRANIVNALPSSPANSTIARYDRNARICSAASVQLLPNEKVDALIDGWKEPQERCDGPTKLRLPVYGDYPRSAQNGKLSGSVHALVRLEADGRTESVTIVCATSASFGEAATATIRKIRFSPMTCKGTPTRIAFFLPLDYEIR